MQSIDVDLNRTPQVIRSLAVVQRSLLRQLRFGCVSACDRGTRGRSFVLHRYADVVGGRVQLVARWRHRFGTHRTRSGGRLTTAGHKFVSLAREENAKLIAKVVLKVYQTGVGINVFRT